MDSTNYGTTTWAANYPDTEFYLAEHWDLPKCPYGVQSRSVSLSRIASKIPGPAQLLSFTRRLSRLLEDLAIDVRSWYEPIARNWLGQQAAHLQQVTLIVDGTKVGFTR